MAKKKKKKTVLRTGELFFCVISLLIMIAIGLYFAGRSLYYYSKQNVKIREEAMTLNGMIMSTYKVTKEENGLHQDTDGYYFKGKVANNYVKYGNRLFRVIRINTDGTIKAISEDISATYMWGDKDSYKDSILNKWLDYNDLYYVGVYYNTLPNPEKYLVKTKYTEDTLDGSKVKTGKDKYSSYVTTLGIKDYSTADGKNSFININKSYWIIGHDKDNSNLYVDTDGSITPTTTYESYGVRAVITFKKNIEVTGGNGSADDAFNIKLGDDANKVGSYVKLGDDIWKVYFENKDTLRLHLDKVLYNSSYSDTGSIYDPKEFGSIAYKLNGEFINSKSYKNTIINDYYYTGEMSPDTDYDYIEFYHKSVLCKVGLLNIFDYHTDNMDNYFYMTTTSGVGSMIFVNHNDGTLEDASVQDSKGVVPVVTIKKASIKSGSGTKDDPYKI